MKSKINWSFFVLSLALFRAAPVSADSRIFQFHSGICAGGTCSISIDAAGSVTAVNQEGQRATGRVYEGNHITTYWGMQGCVAIYLDGILSYSKGVVKAVYWDDRTIWGPDSECGTNEGTTESRIADCAKLPGSSAGHKGPIPGPNLVEWNLVSRSRYPFWGRFYEVWKDSKTGLFWSDRLSKEYCKNCGSPDLQELKEADENGIGQVLPRGKAYCGRPDS